MTNLVPVNGWNSVWIAAILAFSTIGVSVTRFERVTDTATDVASSKRSLCCDESILVLFSILSLCKWHFVTRIRPSFVRRAPGRNQ